MLTNLAHSFDCNAAKNQQRNIDSCPTLSDFMSEAGIAIFRLDVKSNFCNNDNMLDLQYIVKKLVDETELTVQEIADKLKVHNTTIYLWLNGKRKPRIELLSQLADLAGYSVFAIYRGNDEYITVSKKNSSDIASIMDDISAISCKLDDKRLELLRNIAIAAPDLNDQTIDLLNRFMGDNVGLPFANAKKAT